MADLIVYFSRAHENYVSGVIRELSIGNTQVAAQMVQKLTGGELFQVEPVTEYSHNYNECIAQAQADQRANARPQLKAFPESIPDRVILCYPNYWSTMPMAMFTFLEHFDFTGKTILPLCTHEGSGMGSSERDIKRLCPGANVEKGLAIQGGRVNQAEPLIKAWLEKFSRK